DDDNDNNGGGGGDNDDEYYYPLSAIIHPSPVINGYRNKNEFTCGTDINGNIAIGFRLGTYKHGITSVCLPTTDCVHLPNYVISIITIANKYIIDHSTLSV
ncbi:hypothetical protein, partial [Salmonella sp. s51228]|uniref:hypothetical protein n=1 Tax=Salmonella sp. s51228 TaxID=3159652 RepID=UPI00397EF8D2